jgi:hypothetical protein
MNVMQFDNVAMQISYSISICKIKNQELILTATSSQLYDNQVLVI